MFFHGNILKPNLSQICAITLEKTAQNIFVQNNL